MCIHLPLGHRWRGLRLAMACHAEQAAPLPLCCPPLPQARLHEAQAASARAASLEAESAELVRRIIEMKDSEAERLNEMNRLEAQTVGGCALQRGMGWGWGLGGCLILCPQQGCALLLAQLRLQQPALLPSCCGWAVLPRAVQVARAKQEAASILAEARAQILAQARRPSSASEGGAAGIVEASMRSLNLSDAAEVPLPGAIARRWAWKGRTACCICCFPFSAACACSVGGHVAPCLLLPTTHCLASSHRACPPAYLPACSLPAHEGGCYGLAFTATGGLLASGGADKSVKLWEPSTATNTMTLHVSLVW